MFKRLLRPSLYALYGMLSLSTLVVANGYRIDNEWPSAGLILLAWLAAAAAVYLSHHPGLQHTAETMKDWVALAIGMSCLALLLYHFWQHLLGAALLLFFFAFLLGLADLAASVLGVGGLLGILIGINIGDED